MLLEIMSDFAIGLDDRDDSMTRENIQCENPDHLLLESAVAAVAARSDVCRSLVQHRKY